MSTQMMDSNILRSDNVKLERDSCCIPQFETSISPTAQRLAPCILFVGFVFEYHLARVILLHFHVPQNIYAKLTFFIGTQPRCDLINSSTPRPHAQIAGSRINLVETERGSLIEEHGLGAFEVHFSFWEDSWRIHYEHR